MKLTLIRRLDEIERRLDALEWGSTTMHVGPPRQERTVQLRVTAKHRRALKSLAKRLGVKLKAKKRHV